MKFGQKSALKLALLSLALLIGNVAVFSKAFLGIPIVGGTLMQSAVGLAVIIGSILGFCYVGYGVLTARPKRIDPDQTIKKITSLETCFEVLRGMDYHGIFKEKIQEVLEQIRLMKKKQDLIMDILQQKFSPGEMTYDKFKAIVDSTETVMCLNVKSIINRIWAFDDDEYRALKEGTTRFRREIMNQKIAIYNQYIDYVEVAVQDNDEILIRLDKLIFELSNLNSLDVGELQSMQALKELDNLISDTKWYKNN